MKQPFRVIVRLFAASALISAVAATSAFERTPPSAAALAVNSVANPGFFSSIQPLSSTSFIGIADGGLVRSLDRGATWSAQSPLDAASLLALDFVDSHHGVVVGISRQGQLRSWRTTDGANAWDAAETFASEAVAARVQMLDHATGWLFLRTPSSSNFSFAQLFRTVDGGASWQALPKPPSYGELRFDDARRGWLLGGAERTSLFRTTDGGASWQAVSLPVQRGEGITHEFALPVMQSASQATIAGIETTHLLNRISQKFVQFQLITSRGGAINAAETGRAEIVLAASDLAGARILGTQSGVVLSGVIAQLREDNRYLGNNSIKFIIENNKNIDLAQEKKGLRVSVHTDGNCVQKTSCARTQRVFQSEIAVGTSSPRTERAAELIYQTDRVESFREPVTDQKRVVRSNNRGFDACTVPSVNTLNVWWANGPYKDLNFYMGGRNRACSQPLLNASWVSQALAIGWNLIPTWVGYQSPSTTCDGCALFSSNAATARTQGFDEANLAANAAEALGLTKPNIIYFNQEKYNVETAAEVAFAEGFNAQLKVRGYIPGLYTHTANVASYAASNPPPEGVWVARWSGSGGSGPSTIPDPNRITGMSDSIFINQRIWQHYGAHFATFGGITIEIDSNIANGPVVGLDGGPQTIDFPIVADREIRSGGFDLNATASSNLPVSFTSLTTAVCTVSGTRVTFVSRGLCTIRASQPGNGSYTAAPSVDRSFRVERYICAVKRPAPEQCSVYEGD